MRLPPSSFLILFFVLCYNRTVTDLIFSPATPLIFFQLLLPFAYFRARHGSARQVPANPLSSLPLYLVCCPASLSRCFLSLPPHPPRASALCPGHAESALSTTFTPKICSARFRFSLFFAYMIAFHPHRQCRKEFVINPDWAPPPPVSTDAWFTPALPSGQRPAFSSSHRPVPVLFALLTSRPSLITSSSYLPRRPLLL